MAQPCLPRLDVAPRLGKLLFDHRRHLGPRRAPAGGQRGADGGEQPLGLRARPVEIGRRRIVPGGGGERHPAPRLLAQAQRAIDADDVARPVAVAIGPEDGARRRPQRGGQGLQVAPVPGAEFMVAGQPQPRGEIGDARPARRVGRLAHAPEILDLEQPRPGRLDDARGHHGAQRLGAGHG